MTKEGIVLETIEYYKTHNRAFDESGGCTYLNDEGDMCAVGRCMLPEYREQYKNNTGLLAVTTAIGCNSLERIYNGLDNILEEEYRGHSSEFWSDLQKLHDASEHWDEDELTRRGKDYVKEKFNIDL